MFNANVHHFEVTKNVLHLVTPMSQMDCDVHPDGTATVLITTPSRSVSKEFPFKNDAIDYALGMVPIIKSIQ